MDEAIRELQSLGHRRSSGQAIAEEVVRRATGISHQVDMLPLRTVEARLDMDVDLARVPGRRAGGPSQPAACDTCDAARARRRRGPHWIGAELPPIMPTVCPGLPMHTTLRRAKFSHPGAYSVRSGHKHARRDRSQRRVRPKLPRLGANNPHRGGLGDPDGATGTGTGTGTSAYTAGERFRLLEGATAAHAPPDAQPAVHVFLDTEGTNPSLARFEQSLRRKRAITDASTLHGRRVATKARRRRSRTRTEPLMITQRATTLSPAQ